MFVSLVFVPALVLGHPKHIFSGVFKAMETTYSKCFTAAWESELKILYSILVLHFHVDILVLNGSAM